MYTKGEWEAMRNGSVLATGISPVTGEEWERKIAQCYGENEHIQLANACFVAASPKMHKAIERALGHIRPDDGPGAITIIKELEEAIRDIT